MKWPPLAADEGKISAKGGLDNLDASDGEWGGYRSRPA